MMKTIFAVLLLVSVCAAGHSPSNYDNCQCVPYYQCNMDGKVNDDGEGIIDIRNGFVGTVSNPQTSRKPCDHYLLVCCLEDEMVPGEDVSPVEPPTGGHEGGHQEPPTGGHEGGHEEPPTGGHDHLPKQKPHVNKGCGYRNPNGIGFRITGAFNNEANFAEFPWMVAVLRATHIDGNIFNAYQCGGSLIHPKVVLTAAHCVHGKAATELSIRAGEWDTQTLSEPLPHQDRDVAVVITHPRYNNKNLHNDFALLILAKPVDLADNVEVVCLPEADENFDYNKCFATGWGKNEFGDDGKYQVILKAVELPVVSHDTCQYSLRKTRLGRYFKLDQSFMCAGGINGIDTCTGDGGSPLVCPLPLDPTRYTQAGIVAWGIGCGQEGVPGVYGDVTKARQWIDEQLVNYKIYSSSYSPGANNNYPPMEGSETIDHGAKVPPSSGHQPHVPKQPPNHGAHVPKKGHQGKSGYGSKSHKGHSGFNSGSNVGIRA